MADPTVLQPSVPTPPAAAQAPKPTPSPAAQSAPAVPAAAQGEATPATGGAAPAKSEERVSSKLSLLVKREKEALAREQSAKTAEERLQAREDALKAREAKVEEFEKLRETNPTKALELLGLSYQQLTDIMLNDGKVTPDVQVKKVEAKVDDFLKSQADRDREAAEREKTRASAQEQQALEEHQEEINAYIEANASKYEFIRFEGAQKSIQAVIDEHYNRTIDPKTGLGKIMSVAEASDRVEAYLEKRQEKRAALEKVKTKVSPPAPPAKPQLPIGQKPPTTLTNGMSAPAKPVGRLLTDEERKARAIAYAMGLRPQG